MNTQLFFCIKVNKQLVKLGKYFAGFNFADHDLPRNNANIGRRENFPFYGMSYASYHRLSNWVPNQSLYKILVSNGTKCKKSNLYSHEYL